MDTQLESSVKRHKFTVEEYFFLAETGVLGESTELIGGDIYDRTPHSPRHRKYVRNIDRNFLKVFANRATVFAQSTVAFEGWSPEPDVMLLYLDDKEYEDRQPKAEEIHLLVEVSETTLKKDQSLKLENYARQGIKEYWIVNLVEDVTEVYRNPRGDGYDTKLTFRFGEIIAPLDFPEDEVDWLSAV